MQKTLTNEWLKKQDACAEGRWWFRDQDETDPIAVLQNLIKEEKYDWAIWLFTHLATKQQNVRLAIYSAQQSLENFEKIYPDDKRPRDAIAAARRWQNNPTEANKNAAQSAAWSAESAQSAAWSAARSAESAQSAAWSAARSAESAAWSAARSAQSAESAAWSAAQSAAWSAARSAESAAWSAARSAESAAYKRICNYGVKVLREGA